MSAFVSAESLVAGGERYMLGHEIHIRGDAWKVMNYIAYQIEGTVELRIAACQLICRIMPEKFEEHMTPDEVEVVARHQHLHRELEHIRDHQMLAN